MDNLLMIPERKVGYVFVAKVACTSIKAALATWKTRDEKYVKAPDHKEIANLLHNPRAGVHIYRNRYKAQPEVLNDWFWFTVVREPMARIVSCWKNKIMVDRMEEYLRPFGFREKMPFAEFCKIVAVTPDNKADQHFISQAASIHAGRRLIPSLILRMETISSSWKICQAALEAWAGSRPPDLPVSNPTAGKANPEITPELKALVSQRYSWDYDLFGYSRPG